MSTSSPSIQPPAPPPDGVRIVRDALAALDAIPELKASFFGGVDAVDIEIAPPLPTYTDTLKDISGGQLTSGAQLTTWRYPLNATLPTRPLATADLGSNGTSWELGGFNSGEVPALTAEAIAFAQSTPQWRAGDLELRLLQVPALYTVLVWLHNATVDWFAVVLIPESILKSGQLFDTAKMQSTLQDIARNYQPVPA
jgi:hypothetical protein